MALTHHGIATIPESRRKWNRDIHDDTEDCQHREVLPERNLLAAVMGMVIHDLALCEGHERRTAYGWVCSKSNNPFSLNWVCKYLDLNPIEIREILKNGTWKSVPGESNRSFNQYGKFYQKKIRAKNYLAA